ncbi:hypothetical protein VCRA2119O147_370018 [Vibrio crassostreae]|uniref:Uncharacterized protein n=1 Tax=Vibrio crassostreae TaxID=246167 RepID=A0A822N1L3_9VIBR|nr:hypothetical protein VCRA2110O180_100027 [Vibrio crassostreae]CAK1694404.1 hypothetical protein VCRA2113O220_100027 [Vibrio crassostreae]CAK1694486.1 hypothetical protein VCRA2110O181_100027 [Vibrio crassostreae]CAK1694631.1 hypothetical protein VCRA2113O198_100027 [Vibrio crassostreae]CAK1695133.1 hypothetical protein VCRA2113O409_100033 [Vibrio crassostreae]
MSLFACERVKIQRLNVDDIGVKWGDWVYEKHGAEKKHRVLRK